MKFDPVSMVHVYYQPAAAKILVGRLALKSRQIFFEYDADFIRSNTIATRCCVTAPSATRSARGLGVSGRGIVAVMHRLKRGYS